jgi:hypothetical protein
MINIPLILPYRVFDHLLRQLYTWEEGISKILKILRYEDIDIGGLA